MEAKRYRDICRVIDQESRHGRRNKQQFSDAVIVKVYYRSVQCDRPVNWACDPENWPERLLLETIGFALPSQSTMSRRLRTLGVLQLMQRVQGRLAEALEQQDVMVKAIDSKPLKVGSYSKDSDARRGRAAGEMARGYKLHAITGGKTFVLWTLTAMNCNDQTGAAMLIPGLDGRWGYLSADNGYDANAVYRQAHGVGHQLIAPPRKANAHVRDVRRNSEQRVRSLDLCADPLKHCAARDLFAASIRRERGQIERNFGNAAMGGLTHPPPWVRRPHRVATWTAAKLALRMLRQLEIEGLRA
jgi:hypothetical protein